MFLNRYTCFCERHKQKGEQRNGIVLNKTQSRIFKAGVYKFKVLKAVESISKRSNRPMIIVTLELERNNKKWIATDYMTADYPERIERFFLSTGRKKLLDIVETEDFENKEGLVNAGTLVWEGKTRPKILNYLPNKKDKNESI